MRMWKFFILYLDDPVPHWSTIEHTEAHVLKWLQAWTLLIDLPHLKVTASEQRHLYFWVRQ